MVWKGRERVLILGGSAYPPQTAEGIVTSKLALSLTRSGYDVTVISTGSTHLYPLPDEEKEVWSLLGEKCYVVPLYSGWNLKHFYHHIRGTLLTSHPLSGVSWAEQAGKIAEQLQRCASFDIILSRNFPAGPLALYLSRRFKIPWVQNWNDPFPHCKFPVPYGSGSNSGISWRMKRFFKQVSQKSAFQTFPSERLRDYMLSYLPGGKIERTKIIPHIMVEDFNCKVSSISPESFVICHAGSLAAERNPELFFSGLQEFIKNKHVDKDIVVKFIGTQKDYIHKMVVDMGLHNVVRFYPSTTYMNSLSEVSKSDVALLIEAPCKEGIFLPSKFVDYLSVETPVLAVSPPLGTVSDMLNCFGGGVLADNTSVRSVTQALDTLWKSWRQGYLKDTFSTSTIRSFYSEEKIVSLYEKMFSEVSH